MCPGTHRSAAPGPAALRHRVSMTPCAEGGETAQRTLKDPDVAATQPNASGAGIDNPLHTRSPVERLSGTGTLSSRRRDANVVPGRRGWLSAPTGTVRIPMARSIWSGTISFGQTNNFPLQDSSSCEPA